MSPPGPRSRIEIMHVIQLDPTRGADAVAVLADAFATYPVMQFVLGRSTRAGDPGVQALTALFVAGRTLRGHPVLGAMDGDELVGVATITPPGDHPTPLAFTALREATWAELGPAARGRYEAYATAHTAPLPAWHHHLNMIGVRSDRAGQGVGRALLDAVHAFAAADPASAGVSLDTELPGNVALYQHVGYRVVGEVTVGGVMPSWTLFRAR